MSASHPFRQIEARGEAFDRSARPGRGANMQAIIDMLNSDDEQAMPSECSLFPEGQELEPLIPGSRSRLFSSPSNFPPSDTLLLSPRPSDDSEERCLSSTHLRMLCASTTTPNQVECLLLPEPHQIKGGRGHAFVGHLFFVNQTAKIEEHLQRWHPKAFHRLKVAASQANFETVLRDYRSEYEEQKAKSARFHGAAQGDQGSSVP